jgi:ligand-binding SRPBCC domain-containing protein
MIPSATTTRHPQASQRHGTTAIRTMITISRHPDGAKAYRLTSELQLPAPRDRVFTFFSDATNLESITPPWMSFRVQTPRPIEMRAGTRIDYKLRVHGLPLRWRSNISVWEPPERFVDEQEIGPYRFWRHEHAFEETDDGTLVRDTVEYAVPLGAITHVLLVKRDLKRIFEFRREKLCAMFS